MKFLIKRASALKSSATENDAPCPEAVEAGFDEDFDRKTWTIEISTLDELIAFAKRNEGRLILDFYFREGQLPEITIYDYYVE